MAFGYQAETMLPLKICEIVFCFVFFLFTFFLGIIANPLSEQNGGLPGQTERQTLPHPTGLWWIENSSSTVATSLALILRVRGS